MFGLSGAAVAGIAGAVIGGVSSNMAAKKAANAQKESAQMSIDAQKEATKLDPRIDPLIYGDQGIVNRIGGLLDRPQDVNTNTFNQGMSNYMGAGAAGAEGAFMGSQQRAQALQGSNIAAPSMSAATAASRGMDVAQLGDPSRMSAAQLGSAAQMSGSNINAPSQNALNLSPAYQDMIYGEAGANPFLTGGIQKGINQSTNAFQDMIEDAKSATQDNLSGVRGGAIASGQYGGSRQGILEARALDDMSRNLGRAATRFGQGNTDAAVAAQAAAYDADRNRALAAMSGLGAQQYSVASQGAQMAQQAAMANMGAQNQFAMQQAANQQDANQLNTGTQNQFAMQNAANQQAGNQFNAASANQNEQFNAANQQAANAANMGMQGQTNNLNSQNQAAGIGLSSGLLGQAYNFNQAGQNADINRIGAVSGLLQPYAGKGSPINVPMYQPVSSNGLGGAIGGATTAMGLYNAFKAPANSTTSGGYNYLNPMKGDQ